MVRDREHQSRFDRLTERLRLAPAITPDLFRVVLNACTRLAALKSAGKADHIEKLIAAGAWTDAALALIELELPAWKLRRLVHDDGEWFCSLSRQSQLPVALDDTADARHEAFALAILGAFIEARGRTGLVRETGSPTVSQVRQATVNVVCCDNFA